MSSGRAAAWRSASVWLLRVVVAGVLVAGATWWGAWGNWRGGSSCDASGVEVCDGFGIEIAAPWLLWPSTVVASAVVVVAATITRPNRWAGRVVWALLITASVMIANRNNVWWSVASAAAALAGMLTLDEAPFGLGRGEAGRRRAMADEALAAGMVSRCDRG